MATQPTRPAWMTLGAILAAGVAIGAFVLALVGKMDVLEAILFIALAIALIVG